DILPGAHAFVLDEAHQIPQLAGQFFSVNISARQLTELASDVLAECAGQPGALSVLQPALDGLSDAVRKARLAFDPLPSRGAFVQLEADANAHDALVALAAALDALALALGGQAERSKGLSNVHERALALGERLSRITDCADENEVRWYEISERGFALSATPLDLAPSLRALREATHAAWIFTSATLSVAENFDHYTQQLGLDDPETLALGSPFDYSNQALCYLPQGLPEPSARDYTERVIEAALPVLHASRGRAFLLFTSHRALRRAAELLEGKISYPLFVQGSVPRHQLLNEFRASGNGVLLGAASFWEGVDVAGQALSCVIIDKLPFAAPDDPVLQARLEALARAGANPFTQWQVPNAVIALKQGAGRLIRDVHDRGVLMLCDPRLTSRAYGRVFLGSLPPMPRTLELADVQSFFV
ncbi:MAG: helicase, partial [Rhodanobacteraceae bacterium]